MPRSADIGAQRLATFLAELASGDGERPPVAATTLGRKVACSRSFSRHLRREGLMDHDPTGRVVGFGVR